MSFAQTGTGTVVGRVSAKNGAKMVSKIYRSEEKDIDQVLNQISDEPDRDLFGSKMIIYSKGESALIDQIKWKTGVSKIINLEGKYHFILVDEVLPAQNQSMEEAIDAVRNDYQDFLMSKWIENLHRKYKVQINETVLKSLQ